MEFEDLKKELLRRAKKANACTDGYDQGLRAQNKSDLLKAITDNWRWVMSAPGIINAGFLEENFTEQELTDAHIYTSGYHEIFSSTAFACGSSTVKAYDSSTVKAYDSSTVKAYDSSTVKAYDSSTVKAHDSSTVKAHGSSTVKAHDSSTVEAYDSSTVEAYDESYVEDCHGGIRPADGRAIVKDYSAHKIYIKKGAFEIVQID